MKTEELMELVDKCIVTYAIHGTSDYMIVDDGKARAEVAVAVEALQAELEQVKGYWKEATAKNRQLLEERDALQARARELCDLVRNVHKAKGRYHTQLAMCDLFDSVGLSNERPGTKNPLDALREKIHDEHRTGLDS